MNFSRYHALNSLNCFVPSTIPRRFYSEDYWFSKYGHGQPCHVKLLILQIWARSTMPRRIYNEDYWFFKYGHGQPCHGEFTAYVEYTRLLFSKYCSVITRRQRERYRARRERGTEEQRLARLARRREHDRCIDTLEWSWLSNNAREDGDKNDTRRFLKTLSAH